MIRFSLVRVTGRSMEPTLHEGDVVVAGRGIRPKAGRLALVQLPPQPDGTRRPLAVKRLARRDPADATRWWVERDNPREGVDSWQVGSIAERDVIAVVVGRLPVRVGRAFRDH